MPTRGLSLPALVVCLAVCGGCTTADPPMARERSATVPQATTATATSPTTLPEPSSTPARPPTQCSSVGLPGLPRDQPDLPALVADRRKEIVAAAERCDYDALAEMAAPGFLVSFGGGDPATLWREAEEQGEDPMRRLVLTLELPSALDTQSDTAQFVWPSAFAYESWGEVPVEDRDALVSLYSAEDLAFFEDFDGFFGERVGITAEGEWMFFVGGD